MLTLSFYSLRKNNVKTLNVDLGTRSYPIYIDRHIQDMAFDTAITGSQVLIVTNETIAPIYLDQLQTILPQADTLVLPDGEQYKNLQTLNLIFDELLQRRHSRTTTLVALGGGVIGDMTGFAAAAYQRGVNFIQVPTTLLAQVDSSVGGKTAVNHPQGKNMIGAFHQPQAVFIAGETLTTLPDREYAAGMAEVIKYGFIFDADFLVWLEENVEGLNNRDVDLIAHAVYESCRIKAEVVACDETEKGLRAILNLGHTFGHAIEAAQGYKDWLHGEAVGAGMVMAADMSYRMGNLSSDDFERVKRLTTRCGLPVAPPAGISVDEFLSYMGLDKKVHNGKLRLVLLEELGKAVVTDQFSAQLLETLLADYCW